MPVHTLDQAFPTLGCKDPPPSPASVVQSALAAVSPEIESSLHICEYTRRTAANGVSREYASRSLQSTQEAVKTALSNLFITGAPEKEGQLKNSSYKFIETGITDIAGKRAMDDIFDRRTDRRTESTSFLKRFISRVLESSQFTLPVAQIIQIHMGEFADEWRLTPKAKALPSVKVGYLWLQPPPTSSSSHKSDHQNPRNKN